MKVLKWILFTILALVALVLITALFVKKEYALEREVVINRPKQEVFDYVKYLKNQDNYSRWASMDPNMKREYRGTDGTVGFVSAWEGKKVGEGEQEIMRIMEGARIDYELRFLKPIEGKDRAYMITEAVSENQTRVKWGFDGSMKYPLNAMLLFMDLEGRMGNDFQTGLNRLKEILENR